MNPVIIVYNKIKTYYQQKQEEQNQRKIRLKELEDKLHNKGFFASHSYDAIKNKKELNS